MGKHRNWQIKMKDAQAASREKLKEAKEWAHCHKKEIAICAGAAIIGGIVFCKRDTIGTLIGELAAPNEAGLALATGNESTAIISESVSPIEDFACEAAAEAPNLKELVITEHINSYISRLPENHARSAENILRAEMAGLPDLPDGYKYVSPSERTRHIVTAVKAA